MPDLPRLKSFADIPVVPFPTPKPEIAGHVQGALAQGAANLEGVLGHITAKEVELEHEQRNLTARFSADQAAFSAYNNFVDVTDQIRQGKVNYETFPQFQSDETTKDLSGPIQTDHLMQAYTYAADTIYQENLVGISKQGSLAQYAYTNEFTTQARAHMQRLHTEKDQRKVGELQQGFRDQVKNLTFKAGQTEDYNTSLFEQQYNDLITKPRAGEFPNATSLYTPEQLQVMKRQDLVDIQASPYRYQIASGKDGAFTALREIGKSKTLPSDVKLHLRDEAHKVIGAENAELTSQRQQDEFEDKSSANKSYASFIQNSLNSKTSLEDLESILQADTMKQSLSWETGSLYDNAVAYVSTLRERRKNAAHVASDRNTLIDVETGIYTGRMNDGSRMRDVRDLNRYASKLSDEDYKAFSNTLASRVERRVSESYTQAQQEINLAVGVIPSLLNYDSKISDLAYDMKSEFNGLTRALRDANNHDPNAYLKISREVVGRYTPRIQSQMLISVQDRIKNLVYKTPEEAAKALGGEHSMQYRSWLMRYAQLQELLTQVGGPETAPKKPGIKLPSEEGGGKKTP